MLCTVKPQLVLVHPIILPFLTLDANHGTFCPLYFLNLSSISSLLMPRPLPAAQSKPRSTQTLGSAVNWGPLVAWVLTDLPVTWLPVWLPRHLVTWLPDCLVSSLSGYLSGYLVTCLVAW